MRCPELGASNLNNLWMQNIDRTEFVTPGKFHRVERAFVCVQGNAFVYVQGKFATLQRRLESTLRERFHQVLSENL